MFFAKKRGEKSLDISECYLESKYQILKYY